LASEHVKVVLTGQGADEPLGGYQRYQGEIVSAKIPRTLIKWAGNLVNVLGIKNEKIIRASNSLGEKDDVKRFVKVYSIFNEAEIEKLLNIKEKKSYKAVNYYYQLLNCKKKKKSVERMMAIDTRMNLSDDLLIYTDKITMNFSLECRVPLLDTELINFIESLPSEFR
ncbi:MAG: asparagine synthetase B, partial [Bacteroidetes bacterium CG_4_8_14_3_um_filter_31_14]